MEFKKENFNGVFKATLNSLPDYPGVTNSKKLEYYKLIVSKFHYFVYFLLLHEANRSLNFSEKNLKKLNSILRRVKDGKFEQKINKETFEVSLETLSNILVRKDIAGLDLIFDKPEQEVFNLNSFNKYFIEKNFGSDDLEFTSFLEAYTSYLIANETAKDHLVDIQGAFENSEIKKIFHVAQESRGFSTYSAIGESVQKQSISTNAGWPDRIQWIIDTFSNWSGAIPLNSISAAVVNSTARTLNEYSPNNILLFGPPGTGKSRAAIVLAAAILEDLKIDLSPETLNLTKYPTEFKERHRLNFYSTQFHPSYAYEDFFEGLRPVQTLNNDRVEVSYCVVPGIFKAVCQIARAYLEPKEYGIELMVQFIKEGAIGRWELSESSTVSHYKLSERPGILKFKDKPVLYTGGDAVFSEADIVSHQPPTSGLYPVKWIYTGNSVNSNFVLFIDELNRGNPAKIFGEALSLIEESKRIGKSEKIEIILPYSHESFAVPPNVHIICAMNSADKSLSSLDQAFRRRFKFIYLAPSFETITTEIFKERSEKVFSDEILESLKNHFVCINNALKATRVPQENYIGHSYLFDLLRLSFRDEKRARALVQNGDSRTETLEQIVRGHLRGSWESVLHSQVREIVGDNRLQDFCDNFASEVNKIKVNALFLTISQDISKSLYEYLENLQPSEVKFPWKSAA